MPTATLKHLPQTNRKRRGHDFWPTSATVRKIPGLYQTEDVPVDEKIVHLHYFGPSQDFYIVEVDPETGLAFGFAELFGPGTGEWGLIYLPELEEVLAHGGLSIIERDCFFEPKPFKDARR